MPTGASGGAGRHRASAASKGNAAGRDSDRSRVRFIGVLAADTSAKLVEKTLINFEPFDGFDAKFQFNEHVDHFVLINKFDGRDSVPGRFLSRFVCETARRHYDSFVGATLHCSSKIADDRRCNCVGETLALKQYLEAHKRVHLDGAMTIYTTVAATASDNHLHKA